MWPKIFMLTPRAIYYKTFSISFPIKFWDNEIWMRRKLFMTDTHKTLQSLLQIWRIVTDGNTKYQSRKMLEWHWMLWAESFISYFEQSKRTCRELRGCWIVHSFSSLSWRRWMSEVGWSFFLFIIIFCHFLLSLWLRGVFLVEKFLQCIHSPNKNHSSEFKSSSVFCCWWISCLLTSRHSKFRSVIFTHLSHLMIQFYALCVFIIVRLFEITMKNDHFPPHPRLIALAPCSMKTLSSHLQDFEFEWWWSGDD